MSMDSYLLQPYINTVTRIMGQDDQIEYDESTGTYTITTKKDRYKILQLTDIHLGGSIFSLEKDRKAFDACYQLLAYTRPDLVIVTGDLVFPMGVISGSRNNKAPVIQFANFMKKTGIPWAFTYGNHDTEEIATLNRKEFDEMMKSLSYQSSKNLLYPYMQPKIHGRNNQMIEIRKEDESLIQALFLLDSNEYILGTSKRKEYDYIHDDQVEWYESKVLQLNEQEGDIVSSMMFFHIPLKDYIEANECCESGSDEVIYYYGVLGEKTKEKICSSKHESKLFETAVRLQSTKAMFFGHDHYNNQSIEYRGIRMTYGYSIDYLVMPGIEDDLEQRGATLIIINQAGNFGIKPCRFIDLK